MGVNPIGPLLFESFNNLFKRMIYSIALVIVMRVDSAVTLHGYALLNTCGNSTVLFKHLLGDVTSLLNLLTSLLDGIDAVLNGIN